MVLDNGIDNYDKSTGRTADLHAASSQNRNKQAAVDGRYQSLFRGNPDAMAKAIAKGSAIIPTKIPAIASLVSCFLVIPAFKSDKSLGVNSLLLIFSTDFSRFFCYTNLCNNVNTHKS